MRAWQRHARDPRNSGETLSSVARARSENTARCPPRPVVHGSARGEAGEPSPTPQLMLFWRTAYEFSKMGRQSKESNFGKVAGVSILEIFRMYQWDKVSKQPPGTAREATLQLCDQSTPLQLAELGGCKRWQSSGTRQTCGYSTPGKLDNLASCWCAATRYNSSVHLLGRPHVSGHLPPGPARPPPPSARLGQKLEHAAAVCGAPCRCPEARAGVDRSAGTGS